MTIAEEIQTTNARIKLTPQDIIELRYKPDQLIELEDVMEVEQALIQLSKGGDIYCLVDLSNQYNSFTSEAQNYLSKDAPIVREGKMKKSAVVIGNLPSRLIARFFGNFYKPHFPFKIFSNKTDAIKWLSKRHEEH